MSFVVVTVFCIYACDLERMPNAMYIIHMIQ